MYRHGTTPPGPDAVIRSSDLGIAALLTLVAVGLPPLIPWGASLVIEISPGCHYDPAHCSLIHAFATSGVVMWISSAIAALFAVVGWFWPEHRLFWIAWGNAPLVVVISYFAHMAAHGWL